MKGVLDISNKERFLAICENIKRDGMEDLVKWLEKSDFFTAPASRMYHGDYEGGLVEHSLNVYDELKRLLRVYPEISADEETIAIISLFHDLCKVNFYGTEKRNRKNSEGKWESYDSYTVKEKLRFGGHGSKSMFIAQTFIKLTPEEAIAINCHMGAWDGNKDVGNAYAQFPLAWLLHVADESATYVLESKES